MKNILCIFIVATFYLTTSAQENFKRMSFNLGLTHSIVNEKHFPNLGYAIDPEIEALLNVNLIENSILSTGITLQKGEHHIIKEIDELRPVEGYGNLPWNYSYHYKFQFYSLMVPLYVETILKKSFIDSYIAGGRLGWISKSELMRNDELYSTELNQFFIDFSFGLNKNFLHPGNSSLGISPVVGYRAYLSDKNDWQKGYFFYQLKFNLNL